MEASTWKETPNVWSNVRPRVLPRNRLGRLSRDAHQVATDLSLNVTWQADAHVSLTGIYSHSFPGPFLRDTGPSLPIDYFEFTTKVLF